MIIGTKPGTGFSHSGVRPSRTPATENQYRRACLSLEAMAAREAGRPLTLPEVIDWLTVQHGRWSKGTVRSHAAALAQVVRDAASSGRADAAVAGLLTRLAAHRPTPRLAGPKRGAARKRKSCPPEEFEAVRAVLRRGQHPDDALLASYLTHAAVLGLRPAEWAGAELRGDELVVRNAKATNSRACGDRRVLRLGPLYASLKRRADLAALIAGMRERLGEDAPGRDENRRGAGGPATRKRRALGRLGARLRRACTKAGVRQLCLYSFRHVALAIAKREMPAAEVAAVAGHASDRTAGSHYAKARGGWRLPARAVVPSPETLARVRVTGRDRRRAPAPAAVEPLALR